MKDTLIPQLIDKPVSGSDLDVRVVSAYLNQCTAEAQEGKQLYIFLKSVLAMIF